VNSTPAALRVDHPLHHHGELGARVRDARVGAVGHGPVRPERRPAAAHRVQHGVDADHVEVGVLLTREARAREVLGGGRRPHRDGHRLAEREVGGGDRGGDVVGDGRGEQGVAGPDREVGGVQQRGDPGGVGGLRVRRGAHAEAVGHREARAEQLGEVDRLAPGEREVPGVGEVENGGLQRGHGTRVAQNSTLDEINSPKPAHSVRGSRAAAVGPDRR
jgi:hypothetical protein